MSNTYCWWSKLGWRFNPVWYTHESKDMRRILHRRSRHKNKQLIRKGYDPVVEDKTRGWCCW